MSESGRRPDGDLTGAAADRDRSGANTAWSIVSYQIAGMLVYGGIGWLIDRWLGTAAFAPIGVIAGLAGGLYLAFVRINRSINRP